MREKVEELHNRYRNAANYVDSLIGELSDELDFSRTVLVVTGDHGESLFEDGTLSHSSRLSGIQTHTPMVFVGAAIPPGAAIREATSHADFVDTLLPRLTKSEPTLLLHGAVSEHIYIVDSQPMGPDAVRLTRWFADFLERWWPKPAG